MFAVFPEFFSLSIAKSYHLFIYFYFLCTWLRVFKIRILFGPKSNENSEWRRLYSEEFHNLYHSSNIIGVIKSRRLRWAGNVARMEEGRSAIKILRVNLQERDLQEDLGVGGRTMVKWILNKYGRYHCKGLRFFGSGWGLLESPCVCGIEPGS